MTVEVAPKDQIVAAAIREISHIATLPEITLKIVELVEDPKSTAQNLHKVISNDPALCSRILKVVNSSFYGLPGQIASINRAIVLLGLNAVKNIAIAASLAKLFRGGDLTPKVSVKDLWNHSVASAMAGKMIADTLKIGLSDEAFLAGLIHDIGIMVELQADRAKLLEVMQKLGGDKAAPPSGNMIETEQAVFGASHENFGAGLCEKWKFPKSLVYVTGFHHRPLELASEHRTLSCLVYLADRLAAENGDFRMDLPNLDIDPGVLDHLKLGTDKLAEVRARVAEAAKNAPTLLS